MRAVAVGLVIWLAISLRAIAAASPPIAAVPGIGAAGVDDGEDADAVAAVIGPSIGAVISAAYRSAGLDSDPAHGWIQRARLAGLVPWVTVRTSRDTSWQDQRPDVGHATTIEVRATWRLDRLLFDGRELQVAAVEAARRRERRRLASRVIRAYFTWRRAASVIDGHGATRIEESAAELDALTEGWFSDEVTRLRRAASEARTKGAPTPTP